MSELAYWAPLWVQAPFGARVLSFVCCAPNDGFSPQSGLIQREVLYTAAWGQRKPYNRLTGLRVLKFDGTIAPRVLRFDAPPARGLWYRPLGQ